MRVAARARGGDVCGRDGIACPGSDHSQADRSPGVRLAPGSPDVFFIFSHAAIRFANAGISPGAARACALASTSCHAPPKINQHPFLDEEQHAKHMMFARSIWDVAKSAKGIRILLHTAVSLLPHSPSASPLAATTPAPTLRLTAGATSHRTVITDRPAATGGLNSPRWSCP
jgi:hypothetical protein